MPEINKGREIVDFISKKTPVKGQLDHMLAVSLNQDGTFNLTFPREVFVDFVVTNFDKGTGMSC